MRAAHFCHTHPNYPLSGAEFTHSTFRITLKSNQGKDDKTKGKTFKKERTRRRFIMRKEVRLVEGTA